MIPVTTNSLQSQLKMLESIVLKNFRLKTILDRAPNLSLPNWYLGAGCIAQTVWNFLCGRELLLNINDADLVYFDDADLSFEAEARKVKLAGGLFSDLFTPVEVKNQARVHLWYEEHFGYPIQPYQSAEEAISNWPTTATAIGVRINDRGAFTVYAPFGLEDLLGMIVRPNKKQITEEVYLDKVNRWKSCWPDLKVIPW